jgi:hypothetical protein
MMPMKSRFRRLTLLGLAALSISLLSCDAGPRSHSPRADTIDGQMPELEMSVTFPVSRASRFSADVEAFAAQRGLAFSSGSTPYGLSPSSQRPVTQLQLSNADIQIVGGDVVQERRMDFYLYRRSNRPVDTSLMSDFQHYLVDRKYDLAIPLRPFHPSDPMEEIRRIENEPGRPAALGK